MARPQYEVADVVRRFGAAFEESHRPISSHRRVLGDIAACRTAQLGGHRLTCPGCNYVELSYNSCRNRHCPKCGAKRRAQWLEAQVRDLLPVPYFHIVFTLPAQLGPIALQNKRLIYGLLMRTAADTLKTLAADNKHLGAHIGLTAVLHTWGQNLKHHPHVHCIVPGGGLRQGDDGATTWVPSRTNFFIAVRVIRKLFAGKFLAGIRQLYDDGELQLHGRIEYLRERCQWKQLIRKLYRLKWVVYAKPPFGGPQQVLKYLARYTHRVAIANSRIIAVDGGGKSGRVTFKWKDYRDGQRKLMTLDAAEFLRRFCLHIAPKGMVRIRHYGMLAGRNRSQRIDVCRQVMAQAGMSREVQADAEPDGEQHGVDTAVDSSSLEVSRHCCPRCGSVLLRWAVDPVAVGAVDLSPGWDSS